MIEGHHMIFLQTDDDAVSELERINQEMGIRFKL